MCNSASYPIPQVLLAGRPGFFNGSLHIVWWILALLKERSKDEQTPLIIQPAKHGVACASSCSSFLPTNPSLGLQQSHQPMPEPLWSSELAKDFAESSANDLPGLGHGVTPASLAQVSLEQSLSICQSLKQFCSMGRPHPGSPQTPCLQWGNTGCV